MSVTAPSTGSKSTSPACWPAATPTPMFFGLDSAVRPGFTGIRLEVTPIGPESPERYQELADAVDAHCPVLDLFTNATPVERRLAVPAA